MNLKAKIHVESQKKKAQDRLAARQAGLKEKGLDDVAVQRDATFRKIKADIRKANARLSAIAAQENLNAENVKSKVERQAAKKAAQEKPKAAAKKSAEVAEKKPKKEKAKKKK
jgi:hypothetical protein